MLWHSTTHRYAEDAEFLIGHCRVFTVASLPDAQQVPVPALLTSAPPLTLKARTYVCSTIQACNEPKSRARHV